MGLLILIKFSLLIGLLTPGANSVAGFDGVPVTVPANLEVAVAGDDVEPPLVGEAARVAAGDRTGGPFEARHLGVVAPSGVGLDDLLLEMGSGHAVVAAGEERARGVLVLHALRRRPLHGNLHRLVVRRQWNLDRVRRELDASRLAAEVVAVVMVVVNHARASVRELHL